MRQGEVLSASCLADSDGIFDRAMSPSDMVGVFLRRELCVMNDEIGPSQELAMLSVPSGYLSGARRQLRIKWLMIRRIH